MAKKPNTQSNEIWKDIPGWIGFYQVSSLGRVKALKRRVYAPNRWGACYRTYPEKAMKLYERPAGHLVVSLAKNGVSAPHLIHRLVCAAFNGPCPEGKQHCAHWDGNPKNNRPSNLRWATAKENAADTKRHGRLRVGEKSNLSKLSEEQVLDIRARAKNGEKPKGIASEMNVTPEAIGAIINRKNWKHI